MRGLTAGRRDRWAAGAVFLLLACVLSFPSKAQAGCSRYVTYRTAHDHLAPLHDPLISGEAGRHSAEPSPPTAPDLPRPCTGPSCSGSPAPPPAPATTEARYVAPWACLGTTPSLLGLGSRLFQTRPSRLRPALTASGIFHPPREIALLPLV